MCHFELDVPVVSMMSVTYILSAEVYRSFLCLSMWLYCYGIHNYLKKLSIEILYAISTHTSLNLDFLI